MTTTLTPGLRRGLSEALAPAAGTEAGAASPMRPGRFPVTECQQFPPPAGPHCWVYLMPGAKTALSTDSSPALPSRLRTPRVRVSGAGQWLWWAPRHAYPQQALQDRSGSDLIGMLAAHCAQHGQRLLLLGSTPLANGGAVQRLRQRCPGLQVAGFAPPADQRGHDGAQAVLASAMAAIDAWTPHYVVLDLGAMREQRLAEALAPRLDGRVHGLLCLGQAIKRCAQAGPKTAARAARALPRSPALPERKHLDVLGFQMLSSHAGSAARTVLDAVEGLRAPTAFMHANLNTVFHVHAAATDEALPRALRSAGAGVFFEGVALKIGQFLLTGQWMPDISGTDLVPEVMGRLPQRQRVVLIGGRPGIADKAAHRLVARFADVEVVGVWDGYDDIADLPGLLRAVSAVRPDIVLVGLGTPIQEPFCVSLLTCPSVRVAWAVGGLLDYLSGEARLAPSVVRQARLEWLWRLVCNPGRYWRRTIVHGPWFACFLSARLLMARLLPKGRT